MLVQCFNNWSFIGFGSKLKILENELKNHLTHELVMLNIYLSFNV